MLFVELDWNKKIKREMCHDELGQVNGFLYVANGSENETIEARTFKNVVHPLA